MYSLMLMLIYCIVSEHPVCSQNTKLSLVKAAWLLAFADFGQFEFPVACLGAMNTR